MGDESSMYNAAQRALQDQFDGRRLADALEDRYRLEAFGEDEIRFIERSEFFFLATAHEGSIDCSFKGGPAGFVQVRGPTTLEWPDYDGNSMYRSLGNIRGTPRAGLLFIRFGEKPRRLRVNGPCEILEGEGPIKMRIRLTAEEIFPNCPRYIPDLASGTPSKYIPDDSGLGRKPGWKNEAKFTDLLPKGDPHRD